jgi:hypothetical protein
MTVIEDNAPAPAQAKPKRERKPKSRAIVTQMPPPPPAPPAPPPPANMLELISRALSDPAVDVAKLSALLDIRDREKQRSLEDARLEAEAAFNAAMAAVQGKMIRVATDATNSSTKSAYATYAALDRAIRPLYSEAGFGITFNEDVGTVGADMVRVIAYVTHVAPGAKIGHTRIYHCDIPADGKGAKGGDVMTKTHAHGSAFTYGKRYLLGMIFNIAIGRDDDGNAASDTTGAITALQLQELEALIKEVDARAENVCKACKVESLAELTQTQFEKAKAKLETMRPPL